MASSPTPDYAVQLAEWERECALIEAKREGYCVDRVTFMVNQSITSDAQRKFPLPPRPLPPKVPRVVQVGSNMRFRLNGQVVESQRGSEVSWYLSGWDISQYVAVASLAQRPYEGDEVLAVTPLLCEQLWIDVGHAIGSASSTPDRLAAFARAVLTTFGGK